MGIKLIEFILCNTLQSALHGLLFIGNIRKVN
jgi:hypothetical protein